MSDQFYLKIDKNIDLIWIDDQSFSEIIDKRVHNDSSWILDSLVILYTLFYEESNVLMRSFFCLMSSTFILTFKYVFKKNTKYSIMSISQEHENSKSDELLSKTVCVS